MIDKKIKVILIGVMIFFLLPLQVKDVAGQDSTYIDTNVSMVDGEFRAIPFYLKSGNIIFVAWDMIDYENLSLYFFKQENYDTFLDSQTVENPILNYTITNKGYFELQVENESYYFLVIRNIEVGGRSVNLKIWIYRQDESNYTQVNNYYVNDTYVNNTYVNNYYENNTYENQTNINNTYEVDDNGGVYLNSPEGIGTILSVSLIIGSCISLLPYAFNVIRTRVSDSKKRRKLGDLDS